MGAHDDRSLPGLDLRAFHRWYDAARPGELDVDLRASVIVGGRSNLTYDVTDGRTRVVVRRPPLAHVQDTAHDMRREHTVMSALAGSRVPVPTTLGLCVDPSVIGAPFYVMAHVEGTPVRRAADLAALGADVTGELAGLMVEVLGDLHGVDAAAVGLAGLGRPEGYLRRQVDRWGRQLAQSQTRPLPDADRLLARLAGDLPDDTTVRPHSLVHGDFRMDNLLCQLSELPAVHAVLDWEMATLGDPLTDLALLLVYDELGRTPAGAAITDVSTAPGYPTPDEQVARYVAVTGRPAGPLGFHLALAHLKVAVILEGIHHRYLQGQTVGPGFEALGEAVQPLLAAGLAAGRGDR